MKLSQVHNNDGPHVRTRRAYDPFDAEVKNYCTPGRCTMIQCTVGGLAKDESVIFKIRSRLFEETQIKVRKELVFVQTAFWWIHA